ncbi:hypothetical protein FYC62_04160 [Pedobacter aquae]|uniref:DUF1761 domain-containing protein n=1 Tax=Pedobacter aquae TaxID=2605747 RepID=A0A5C0VE49_9SPHI|nr:hypothetical protein [Pedobacter aquae]QEK50958.1 hypothetical protein FYC62_04160 [Pedobacter aquae]
MKKVLLSGLGAGLILFLMSYCGLLAGVTYFPELFVEYNNPLFNSDGSRDLLFFMHPFIMSFALSWFWARFKKLFHGTIFLRGLEFGFVYAIVALLPVMWITFSSLDITLLMISSWFLYGFFQAVIAGLLFAKINP